MTSSQKLLLGSIGVIAAMTLFLVSQYASRSDMVEFLPTADLASQGATRSALESAGVEATLVNGKLMVPSGQQDYALSVLAQSGQLPNDTTLLFASLLDKQGFYYSRQQNDQMYLMALQNELARIISGFRGVRDAAVLLDVPEPRGIGRSVRAPTASATVFTTTGRPLDQGEVDAIAQLIAGAKAGLLVENIRVIDGSVGRQRRPTNPDEMLATTYIEQTAAAEEKLRQKLGDMLGYIRGVTIAVTAQVDVTRVSKQSTKYLNPKEGTVSVPSRVKSASTTQSQATRAAEPGVRSNATGSILSSSSGGSGTSLEDSDDETQFENGLGSETVTEQDPRGMPTMLAASVNIPRSYVVGLLQDAAAEGEEPVTPTDAEIDARFEIERAKIEDSIRPHLVVAGEPEPIQGTVVVSLIPVDLPAPSIGDA
ncbi:MAG: flagellar M-ring protein FliF C-terminal domain-containing protein, partial [Phycisphaerales bacterium JB041]